MKPNAYKFNGGTELTDAFGWQMYDTPFRSYDAQLGRFHQIDPLADKSPNLNPYRFGFNNPILFNDPTGLYETMQELIDEVLARSRHTRHGVTSFSMVNGRLERNIVAEMSWDEQVEEFSNEDPTAEYLQDSGGGGCGFWDLLCHLRNIVNTYTAESRGELSNLDPNRYEHSRVFKDMAKTRKNVNVISNTQLNPYLTISVGKQSNLLLNPLSPSLFGSFTLTPNGRYLSGGIDFTAAPPAVGTGWSGSVSFGLNIGAPSSGGFIGVGGGSFVGFEASRAMDGSAYSFGLNISNSPIWFGGNIGASYWIPNSW